LKSINAWIVALIMSSTIATTALAAATLDADFSRSNIRIPSSMKSGQSYDVTIKVKNVGDIKWQARDIKMKCTVKRGPSGAPTPKEEFTPEVDLSTAVNTGQTWDCRFKVRAPKWTGRYTLQYSMADGRNEFGDKVDMDVEVVGD